MSVRNLVQRASDAGIRVAAALQFMATRMPATLAR